MTLFWVQGQVRFAFVVLLVFKWTKCLYFGLISVTHSYLAVMSMFIYTDDFCSLQLDWVSVQSQKKISHDGVVHEKYMFWSNLNCKFEFFFCRKIYCRGGSRLNRPYKYPLVGAAGTTAAPTNRFVGAAGVSSRPYKWICRSDWCFQPPLQRLFVGVAGSTSSPYSCYLKGRFNLEPLLQCIFSKKILKKFKSVYSIYTSTVYTYIHPQNI